MAIINLGEIPELKNWVDVQSWARTKIRENPSLSKFFLISITEMSDAEIIEWCLRKEINGA